MSALVMWTIYDHPADYPDSFVARRWVVDAQGARSTDRVLVSDDVNWLRRQFIEDGLSCLVRDARDDPAVMETWV